MWYFKNDKSQPVITSKEHIVSKHRSNSDFKLPNTAILLYMNGIKYILENYKTEIISTEFPRFLNSCPIYKITNNKELCFLDGGRGAPQAVDTLETLNAFGVERIITIGMVGGFSDKISAGDIVIPNRAYCEEGTSLHYYEKLEFSEPDKHLTKQIMKHFPNHQSLPIVSTDAVYRQTLYKENLWRKKGCVGVDMETSALFSVGKYLNIAVASILMVSDIHPQSDKTSQNWDWHMTPKMRTEFLCQSVNAALNIL